MPSLLCSHECFECDERTQVITILRNEMQLLRSFNVNLFYFVFSNGDYSDSAVKAFNYLIKSVIFFECAVQRCIFSRAKLTY